MTLQEIPQDQLYDFIQKMDGYHCITYQDKSWILDQESKPYQITLYCFLISIGVLFVDDKKLKSEIAGYEKLIESMEDFFKGKCILNFTDLFFLEEINAAFCHGRWQNVHECWFQDREDRLSIIQSRMPHIIRVPTAYVVQVIIDGDVYDMMYFILRGKRYTTIVDFFEGKIFWRSLNFTTNQLKVEHSLESSRITYSDISLQEFYSRLMDVFEKNGKLELN